MPVISAEEPITSQNGAQPEPHPAASVKRSPIVKRIGYCFLTEKQLEHYNKMKQISDEELATVDMQLGSPSRVSIEEAPAAAQTEKAPAEGKRISAEDYGHKPAAGPAIDPQEQPLPQPKQQQPRPTASAKRLPKTIRIGYCLLTEKQLEHFEKLKLISDEELAAVNKQRSLQIDEFPVVQEKFQVAPPPSPPPEPEEDRSEQVNELKLRAHKTYKLQLLNELVRIMDTVPDPKAIIPELQFDFIYLENEEVRQLPSNEREYRRLDAFYDYLDDMFVKGNDKKAIDVVVNGFIRLNNRRPKVSQNGFMSPRSYDLISTQLQNGC